MMPRHIARSYHEAIAHVEFYRWSASRGCAIGLNDPITGKKRSAVFDAAIQIRADVAGNKARALEWLKFARIMRKGSAR